MSGTSLVTGGMISGVASLDWTDAERAQIRSALGVDGAKTTAVGGQLQKHDQNVKAIIASEY